MINVCNTDDSLQENDVPNDAYVSTPDKKLIDEFEKPPHVLQALRYNTGRPKYSLLNLDAFEPCVRVLEFGAKKYAPNNWQKGLKKSEVIDSLMRHLAAIQRGEVNDPESGLSHIGHIQANAMFLGHSSIINDMENGRDI